MATPPKPEAEARLEFRSNEEFRLACGTLAGRLHYLNRVSGGESRFSAQVADLLTRLGRTFEACGKDPEITKAFGNGWEKGILNDEEQRAYLFKLLFDGKD
jgi:hypothetical protein